MNMKKGTSLGREKLAFWPKSVEEVTEKPNLEELPDFALPIKLRKKDGMVLVDVADLYEAFEWKGKITNCLEWIEAVSSCRARGMCVPVNPEALYVDRYGALCLIVLPYREEAPGTLEELRGTLLPPDEFDSFIPYDEQRAAGRQTTASSSDQGDDFDFFGDSGKSGEVDFFGEQSDAANAQTNDGSASDAEEDDLESDFDFEVWETDDEAPEASDQPAPTEPKQVLSQAQASAAPKQVLPPTQASAAKQMTPPAQAATAPKQMTPPAQASTAKPKKQVSYDFFGMPIAVEEDEPAATQRAEVEVAAQNQGQSPLAEHQPAPAPEPAAQVSGASDAWDFFSGAPEPEAPAPQAHPATESRPAASQPAAYVNPQPAAQVEPAAQEQTQLAAQEQTQPAAQATPQPAVQQPVPAEGAGDPSDDFFDFGGDFFNVDASEEEPPASEPTPVEPELIAEPVPEPAPTAQPQFASTPEKEPVEPAPVTENVPAGEEEDTGDFFSFGGDFFNVDAPEGEPSTSESQPMEPESVAEPVPEPAPTAQPQSTSEEETPAHALPAPQPQPAPASEEEPVEPAPVAEGSPAGEEEDADDFFDFGGNFFNLDAPDEEPTETPTEAQAEFSTETPTESQESPAVSEQIIETPAPDELEPVTEQTPAPQPQTAPTTEALPVEPAPVTEGSPAGEEGDTDDFFGLGGDFFDLDAPDGESTETQTEAPTESQEPSVANEQIVAQPQFTSEQELVEETAPITQPQTASDEEPVADVTPAPQSQLVPASEEEPVEPAPVAEGSPDGEEEDADNFFDFGGTFFNLDAPDEEPTEAPKEAQAEAPTEGQDSSTVSGQNANEPVPAEPEPETESMPAPQSQSASDQEPLAQPQSASEEEPVEPAPVAEGSPDGEEEDTDDFFDFGGNFFNLDAPEEEQSTEAPTEAQSEAPTEAQAETPTEEQDSSAILEQNAGASAPTEPEPETESMPAPQSQSASDQEPLAQPQSASEEEPVEPAPVAEGSPDGEEEDTDDFFDFGGNFFNLDAPEEEQYTEAPKEAQAETLTEEQDSPAVPEQNANEPVPAEPQPETEPVPAARQQSAPEPEPGVQPQTSPAPEPGTSSMQETGFQLWAEPEDDADVGSGSASPVEGGEPAERAKASEFFTLDSGLFGGDAGSKEPSNAAGREDASPVPESFTLWPEQEDAPYDSGSANGSGGLPAENRGFDAEGGFVLRPEAGSGAPNRDGKDLDSAGASIKDRGADAEEGFVLRPESEEAGEDRKDRRGRRASNRDAKGAGQKEDADGARKGLLGLFRGRKKDAPKKGEAPGKGKLKGDDPLGEYLLEEAGVKQNGSGTLYLSRKKKMNRDAIRIPREASVIIGREPSKANVVLPHRDVSEVHARISFEHGAYYLSEEDSSYGTFINGEQLAVGQSRKIEHMDEITFASNKYYALFVED